jgi:predicted acylesterase/phospholipase RssA
VSVIPPPREEKGMKRIQFEVIQKSDRRGDDLWDWCMWIKPRQPNKVNLSRVSWVTYGLHPCFPNPNRVIRNPKEGFRLDMSSAAGPNATWGTFVVRVMIVLADGTRELHDQKLLLQKDGGSAPLLMPLPAEANFEQSVRYFKRLKEKSAFGYAREVLARAERLLPAAVTAVDAQDAAAVKRMAEMPEWIAQQKALCTYKDPSLPNETRLTDALAILEGAPCGLDLVTSTDPETLGLGGAIHKRMWEIDRSREHLERSLAFYRRAYEIMLERQQDPNCLSDSKYDAGAFAGANVIYVCCLLARETPAEIDATAHAQRLEEAERVRHRLAKDLPPLQALRPTDWWIAATLLDAYLGLAYLEPACERLALDQAQHVAKITPSPWETQSTGSQLLSMACLQKRLYPDSAERVDRLLRPVVTIAFGDDFDIDCAAFDGKLGLALSGGGFRASLFHIGVLAHLAELDLLRHVEVISCVSGGSIVGAHYYLLLRNLLQTQPQPIAAHRYVKLVEELLEQFLSGVQKNIRMRVAASWIANLRMFFQPSTYSRSQRLGQLYEKHLYALVKDGEERFPRWLNDAFIVPKRDADSWEDSFSPKLDNWRRTAKVPMLALNATTLNTGRNWQFTASWMGEPLSYGSEVDSTERLESVYYSEAPEKLRQYRLGDAVAASSCVPALFTPIVIGGLYPDRTVRLVDGGVHDNQGMRALIDQDCDAIIVSDASGQMASQRNPPHGEFGVILRTNSVLQARVRVAQHQELQVRERASFLRKCAFLHLRERVQSATVRANEAQVASTPEAVADATPEETTEYGINRNMQIALAGLRTDLDSFTDREALALMYSGYAMACEYLGEFASSAMSPPCANWRFLEVREAMNGGDQPGLSSAGLLRHLKVGSRLAFKVWFLHPALMALGIAVVGAAALASLYGLVRVAGAHWYLPVNMSGIARGALVLLAGVIAAAFYPAARRAIKLTDQAMHPSTVVTRWAISIVMAFVGCLLCRVHLWLFDRIFLILGRVKRPHHMSAASVPAREAE